MWAVSKKTSTKTRLPQHSGMLYQDPITSLLGFLQLGGDVVAFQVPDVKREMLSEAAKATALQRFGKI